MCNDSNQFNSQKKNIKRYFKKEEFSLAFPGVEYVSETDYLGIETGYNTDKIEKIGFTTSKASKVDAPIINEFKLSLECRLLEKTDVGSHTQLIAEIVNIQADKDILNEKGKVDLKLLNPIVYDDVGYDYYKVGDKIADAFKTGRKFRD